MCCSPEKRAIKQERRAELKELKQTYKQERRELKTLLKSLKRSSNGHCCKRNSIVSVNGKDFDTRSTKEALQYAMTVLDERYKVQRTLVKSSYREIKRSLSLTPVSSIEKTPTTTVKVVSLPVTKALSPPPQYKA